MKKIFTLLIFLSAMVFGANGDKTAKKQTYILKLAIEWENTLPLLNESALDFKYFAETMSGGRLKIQIHTPAQHKANFEIFDFVKDGKYDLGYTSLYYYQNKDAKMTLWTAVPFGMTNDEQRAWYYYGGGKNLSEKMFSKLGIKVFIMGSTGMQMGGWFKKEIKSLDDLHGLKIRIPGFGAEVMSRLGVTVNTLPTNELYKAFKMGTIDAVEWINPIYDTKLNFHKVADFYYTGWQEPTADMHLLVNKSIFDKLPKDLQVILETSSRMAGENFQNKSFYENAKILGKLKTEYPNIQIKHFPNDVINALKNATEQILEEESEKDPLFKEILQSQRDFQKIGREWKMSSETAFLNSQNKKDENKTQNSPLGEEKPLQKDTNLTTKYKN